MTSYNNLNRIFDKYFTDKGTVGPAAHKKAHNYGDCYSAYLSPVRSKVSKVLEIGIGIDGPAYTCNVHTGNNSAGAASLRAWSEFFPNAMIYGIDINPCQPPGSKIQTFVVDQSSKSQLQKFATQHGPFDLIIDDGSHVASHQQISLNTLWHHLNPGGYYFIEDLMDNGLDGISQGRTKRTDVISTRNALYSLATSGASSKHQLTEFVKQTDIDFINFHAPSVIVRNPTMRNFISAILRKLWVTNYIPAQKYFFKDASEKLVVIKKCSK